MTKRRALSLVGIAILIIVALKVLQPPPPITTYTIGGALWTIDGAVSGIYFGPVTGGRVTSSPAGIDCPPDCVAVYEPGT